MPAMEEWFLSDMTESTSWSPGMLALAETNTAKSSFSDARTADCRPSRGAMQEILSRQPLRRLAPHEHLFYEGDRKRNIYCIERGLVRLYKLLSDGRRQIISFRFPGDVLGSDTLTEQYCSAEAVTEVALRSLPRETAHHRMKEEPGLTSELIDLLSQELANTRSQITVLNRRSAIEKLAAFILDLWRRQSAKSNAGNRVTLELTRTDIADFLGLTIETVSRNLTKLRQRRIIDLPQVHRLIILDMERLEGLAIGGCEDW
jgi:CRP/FNR family transcriptional regulator